MRARRSHWAFFVAAMVSPLASADASDKPPLPLDRATVGPGRPVPLAGVVATPLAAPKPPDEPGAVPARGDGRLLLSPGGRRLLALGDRRDSAQVWARAFDGTGWRLLGLPLRLPFGPTTPALALGADGFVLAGEGAGAGRPRVFFYDGRAARFETLPVGPGCAIEAFARDGDDLLAAGSCRKRGLLLRRRAGRWFDEGVKAPPLHAIASGPGGLVAAGERGAIVLREGRGWVVGSTGGHDWRQAAAGRDATYLFAAGEARVHQLRGRELRELPALPPPVEPPSTRPAPHTWDPPALGPEALRQIIALAGGGGPLAVLAEVPSSGDHHRHRTYGLFAWDGRAWADLGRSVQTDNGDFMTRTAARQIVASDEAIWCDDDGRPTLLWPPAAGGKPLARPGVSATGAGGP
jgi:hypothetical protein